MLTTFLLGVAASLVAEAITWLNARLSGTVLKGDAAFILAAVVAFVGALVEIYLVPTASFQVLLTHFSQVWAVSQVVFMGFVQMFSLDVKSQ